MPLYNQRLPYNEVVNVRTGPDTAYSIISQATRGQRYEIIARSSDRAWWQVCCVQGRNGWIFSDLAQTAGALDAVAVAANVASPSTPTRATPVVLGPDVPTAATARKSVTPAQPTWQFALEMAARHTEANVATIYAWIHEDGQALDGHFLRLFKDG